MFDAVVTATFRNVFVLSERLSTIMKTFCCDVICLVAELIVLIDCFLQGVFWHSLTVS